MVDRMFTAEERAALRSELLEHAARDKRISGAAITGSAAVEGEDRWSDIDLAFGVADPGGLPDLLSDWSALLYERHGAVHHLDIQAGGWLYRVFILSCGLQVDLAFVGAAEFRALSATFRLVFGEAKDPLELPAPSVSGLIGFGWLHALHARTSIARNRLWQAEYMIGGVRNHAFALAAIRHSLPAVHGRGLDDLPGDVAARFEGSLVRRLDAAELTRAFHAAVAALLIEVRFVDEELARRLEPVLSQDS